MKGLLLKYFVLEPEGDDIYAEASREAIKTYAACIKKHNPQFGSELLEWIGGVKEGNTPKEKYKLTDETLSFRGITLHRIEALKDFGNVKKGDKGGWIEKEENLSQEGDCWVYENAKVCGNARIN